MLVRNSKPYLLMKKEKIEELIVKCVDHSLIADEQEQLDEALKADPSLRDEVQKMSEVKSLLQAELPQSVDPPYPDFFNSQLMRKIDLDVSSQQPKELVKCWWQDMRWAWAPVATLALVMAFFAGKRLSDDPISGALVENGNVPSVYFAESNLQAEVISDEYGDVSAILVDGLSELNDKGAFSETAELPVSYKQYEASRFH